MASCQADGHQMHQHLGQSAPASRCFATPACSKVRPSVRSVFYYVVRYKIRLCTSCTCARPRRLCGKPGQGATVGSTYCTSFVGLGRRCHPKLLPVQPSQVSLCCSRTPDTPLSLHSPKIAARRRGFVKDALLVSNAAVAEIEPKQCARQDSRFHTGSVNPESCSKS